MNTWRKGPSTHLIGLTGSVAVVLISDQLPVKLFSSNFLLTYMSTIECTLQDSTSHSAPSSELIISAPRTLLSEQHIEHNICLESTCWWINPWVDAGYALNQLTRTDHSVCPYLTSLSAAGFSEWIAARPKNLNSLKTPWHFHEQPKSPTNEHFRPAQSKHGFTY